MEVVVGTEQFFLAPATGSLWVRSIDTKETSVIAVGTGTGAAVEFQGGTATCSGTDIAFVLPIKRAPTPEEQAQITQLLNGQLGEVPIAFVLESTKGRTVAEMPSDPELGQQTAAVIAIVRAQWAWDESASFTVVVSGVKRTVVASFEDGTWRAEVR